jgi:hypothetical protein
MMPRAFVVAHEMVNARTNWCAAHSTEHCLALRLESMAEVLIVLEGVDFGWHPEDLPTSI